MDIEYKKSGQIPAFGDWDNANELPITQYFECARQAGLVRYSSSSSEYDAYVTTNSGGYGGGSDLYAVGYGKRPPLRGVSAPQRKTSGVNRRCPPDIKERRRQQVKIRDVMDQQPKSHHHHQPLSQLPRHTNNKKSSTTTTTTKRVAQQQRPAATTVKPLDEDLYKIPPELLHKSERKKMLGFLSRCLVPPCKA